MSTQDEGIVTQSRSAYRAANQYGGPMRYIVMAMSHALTCLDLSTAQAGAPGERESLAGLPGVMVVIERIRPDAQADGLSEEAIQAQPWKASSSPAVYGSSLNQKRRKCPPTHGFTCNPT